LGERIEFRLQAKILVLVLMVALCPPIVKAFAEVSGYRTRDQVTADFLAFETVHPSLITHETIGKSVEGRDIYLFKIGNASGGMVLIDASIHGNQHATPRAR